MDGSARLMLLQWSGPWPATQEQAVVISDPLGRARLTLEWLHSLPMQEVRFSPLVHSLTQTLIEYVKIQAEGEDACNDPIDELHRFITTTFKESLSMELLAARSGLSIPTINRQFRQRYGKPPMQLLQGVRVQAAAALLAGSSASLDDIAESVGLSSGNYLARLIRKNLSVPVRSLRGHRE